VVPVAGNGSDAGTQEFFALVEPHLEKLREIAGRVLRYVESRGDLPPGEVELDDIVDKALIRAYDQFLKGRSHEDIRSRLIKFALDEIKAAVKRARTDRGRAVHIEDKIPDTLPAEEVSTLGDEILDFYQPDEDLRMEDVIPDLNVPTPEEIVETEELRSCVRDALRSLPRDAQRALTLRYIIGLRGEELAKSLRKPQAEAEHLVDNARAHLREKLIAVGCTVKTLAG
jgi:RNA polymerase sigma factor (sigma-70 family)